MQPSPQTHPQPQPPDDLIANAVPGADFCRRKPGRATFALCFRGAGTAKGDDHGIGKGSARLIGERAGTNESNHEDTTQEPVG